jgi:hypothetical protein
MPLNPNDPGFHKDPLTGIRPLHEWGNECGRGFVREQRFGSGQVIAGANRDKTRGVYRAQEKAASR